MTIGQQKWIGKRKGSTDILQVDEGRISCFFFLITWKRHLQAPEGITDSARGGVLNGGVSHTS